MRRASINRDKSPTTERVSYSTPDFNLETLWNLSDDEEERACVSFDWRRLVSLFPCGWRMLFPLFRAELSIVHNFLWKNLSFLAQIDRGGGVEGSRAVKFRLVAGLASSYNVGVTLTT